MRISMEFLALLALAGERAAAHPNPGPITTAPTTCGGNPCSDAVAAVPTCAAPCLDGAASVVSCATTDYSCLCSASDGVQSAAQSCVLGNCGLITAIAVASSVQAVCSCVTAHPTTSCPPASPTITNPNTPTSIPFTPTTTEGGGPKESDSSRPGGPTICGQRENCQSLSARAIPGCAQPCFASVATIAGCGSADLYCQCQPPAIFTMSVAAKPCLYDACSDEDHAAAMDGVASVCDCKTSQGCGLGPLPTNPGKTSIPNSPTIISGTAPTITLSPTTGSGTVPSPDQIATAEGGVQPGDGPSAGGGALAGGSDITGDNDGGTDGSHNGSGEDRSGLGFGNGDGDAGDDTDGDGDGGSSADGGSGDTGAGSGTGSGASGESGGGSGGTATNQTVPTGSITKPTSVTAGASGGVELGVFAGIAGAVLFAALAL